MTQNHAPLILAVDPGLSGALAFYDHATAELEVFDMPCHAITRNGKRKLTLDLYALGMLVDSRRHNITNAIVEAVGAMPKQGVTSSFAFGEAYGAIKGVIAANLIPMHLIRPADWKRHYRLTSDKDASRALASRLLPQHAGQWPLKKHDGRAEAALLALYFHALNRG